MKKLIVMLLTFTLLFASCQAGNTEKTPSSGADTTSGKEVPFAAPDIQEHEYMSGTVAALYENSFLLAVTAENNASSLYTVPYCEAEVERGNEVEVAYSGYVLTIYPGIPEDVAEVTVTEEGTDLIGLYLDILDYLYENDPGLNGDIDYISFDFSGLGNLTEAEKRALGYIFSNKIQKQDLYMNVQELEEEGLIKDLYFENGIVLSISTDDTDGEDGFTFSAVKWRSGLGAIGISDCTATLSGREWSYEPGGFWIS